MIERGEVVLGNYRLLQQLGEGGEGQVFLGEHRHLGRQVAIKLLRQDAAHGPEAIQRFLREARAASSIQHPGIVEVYDFGESEGTAYLVMELLAGESLAARLRRAGRLPVDDAVRIVVDIATAVAAAHDRGIAHRDLKPDNVFLVPGPAGEQIKVVDFGLAETWLREPKGSRTKTGTLVGSPTYMSPEQIRGVRVDQRTDIYALGCIFYELVTGAPPFGVDGIGEVIQRQLNEAPVSPTDRVPEVPAAISAVILRCLAKEPGARFATMREVVTALDGFAPARPQRFRADTGDDADDADDADERDTGGRRGTTDRRRREERDAATGSAERPGAPAAPRDGLRLRDPGSFAVGSTPPPMAGAASTGAASTGAAKTAASVPPITGGTIGAPFGPGVPAIFPSGQGHPPGAMGHAAPAQPFQEVPQLQVRPRDTGAMAVAHPSVDEEALADVIRESLPAAFDDAEDILVALFESLFGRAVGLGQHMVSLHGPSLPGDGRTYFATFITRSDTATRNDATRNDATRNDATRDDATTRGDTATTSTDSFGTDSLGTVGTRTFLHYVLPLADRLRWIDAGPGAVLIAILEVAELGPGVRETIFQYRRDRGVIVIPLYVGELRRAHRQGSVNALFLDRLADLHTVADPFSVIGPTSDPTRCLGFGAPLNDLVGQLHRGGQIVSVNGLPGSGKSTLIALAEYEYAMRHGERPFLRVHCADGRPHDPARLQTELQALVDGHAPGTSLVLVLEDAEWLIRMTGRGVDAAQADAAHALWLWLGTLCRRGHTVIVTSVRDFSTVAPPELTKPLSVQRVLVRALDRAGVTELVRELGTLVNFHPTAAALDDLAEASGGNIYALRSICSAIFVRRRGSPRYSPLATLRIEPRDVDEAVAQLAATTPVFRDTVQVWLDDDERAVLEHVARERPRSPRAVGRALASVCPEARARESLGSLQSMGLIAFERGRYRVQIPVLERWVKNHLDRPPARDQAERDRRLFYLAAGLTLTALMVGSYWTWLRSTRTRTAQLAHAGCRFQLDHPDRLGPGDKGEIFVYRECDPGAAGLREPYALETYGTAGVIDKPTIDCGAGELSCTAASTVTLRDQAGDAYRLRLRVGPTALATITMRRDSLASIRRVTEQIFEVAWLLPFAAGLFLAFHREVLRRVRELFSRGGAPAAADGPGDAPRPSA